MLEFPPIKKESHLVSETAYRFDTTYTIKKLLGSGSYGSVYSAQSNKDSFNYAIKRIDMRYNKQRNDYRRQVHEINILFFNRNPYLLHATDIEYRRDIYQLDIATELMVGGNLDDFIRKYRLTSRKIPDHYIWTIFIQCCLGVKYLHLNGIIHRDIKPQNILLDHKDVPNRVVICDFGASICLTKEDSFCSTKIGTPYFMSPEQNSQPKYDKKTDIWSLGCILYEMITMEKPFVAPNLPMLNYKISRGKYKPIFCNENLNYIIWNDLIRRMLEKNPEERITITSILEMPNIRKKCFELGIQRDLYEPMITPTILSNRIVSNSKSFQGYVNDLCYEITSNVHKRERDNIRIEYRPSPIKNMDSRPYSDSKLLLPKITRDIPSDVKKTFVMRLRDEVGGFRPLPLI